MKKVLLLLMSVATIVVSNAQEENDGSGFKPIGSDKTLEVQFAPLGGSPINIGGIKIRSFRSATSALRLNVFLGYSSESDITQQEDGDFEELKDVSSEFNIVLRPGVETHFSGTDRLSPYFGSEVVIGLQLTGDKSEYQDGNDIEYTKEKNGTFTFGINGLAGVDLYVAKRLYLGAELGFGLAFDKELATRTKYSDEDAEPDSNDPIKNGGSFNLGPIVNGQIRLGWVF